MAAIRAGAFPAGTSHPRGWSVQLTQPLFEGFQNLNAIRQAKSQVQAAREALRTVEQTILLDAATAYVNVVRDTAVVRLRENDVTVLTEQLKATKDRFDAQTLGLPVPYYDPIEHYDLVKNKWFGLRTGNRCAG